MKTAFIFPGQGSQHVGMCRELYQGFEEVRALYDEAHEALGYDLKALSFDGPVDELNRTENTQPALLAAGYAAYKIISANGIVPSVVAGHSLGEYTAVVASGALSFSAALRITRMRGQLMQEAVPEGEGLMAAILGLGRQEVGDVCRRVKSGYAAPANYNCPGQIVISGEKKAVEEAMGLASEAGAKKCVALNVSVPSHSALMKKAADRLAEFLFLEAGIIDPQVPIVSNSDAIFLTTPEGIKAALVRQLSRPVLWEDCLKLMHFSGVESFVELGPGRVLSGLARRTLPEARLFNVEDLGSLEKTLKGLSA